MAYDERTKRDLRDSDIKTDLNAFSYTYSAIGEADKKRVLSIMKEYENIDKASDNFTKLKRLDSFVKRIPRLISASMAIIGLFAFGGGMAVTLRFNYIAAGIAISLSGIVIASAVYPSYKLTRKFMIKLCGGKIIALGEEIAKIDKD